MHYNSAYTIEEEIGSVVPLYKMVKENQIVGKGSQWPFPRNGGFDLEGGLARFRLPAPGVAMEERMNILR